MAVVCLLAVTTLTANAAPKAKPVAASKPASNTVRTAPDFTWIGAGGKIYPARTSVGSRW